MLDVLLKNGTVVDGTGRPGAVGDVGIRDGTLAAIGKVDESARRIVDVEGLVVAPGFVDVHAHYDAQLMWDPACSPSPLHGTTTTLVGNCGLTLAPVCPEDEEFLVGLLARVESMPAKALEEGVTFRWRTFPEFLDVMDTPLGINVGFMVGHSALRRAAMGEAASSAPASGRDLELMKLMLREALKAGGFGFSSATATSHFDASGRPSPPKSATASEFVQLASVCAATPGTSVEFIPGSFLTGFTEADVQLMADMSAAAKRPLNWNTVQVVPSDPELHLRQLAASERGRTLGGWVVPMMIPHNSRNRIDFGPSNVGLRLVPGWEWIFELPVDGRIAALSDETTRGRLKARLEGANEGFALVLKETMPAWVVNDGLGSAVGDVMGETVDDLARRRGVEPIDVVLDLAVDSRMTVGLRRDRFGDDSWTRQVRASLVTDPRVVLGASDGGAHCDGVINVEYTTACFRELVRDEHLFTVEGLVREFTDVPARLYGLRHRGRIELGYAADIVVFDPSAIRPGPLQLVNDLPAGAHRLFSTAIGIDRVFVAGREIVINGALTGALPGRLLRSGRDSYTPSMFLP